MCGANSYPENGGIMGVLLLAMTIGGFIAAGILFVFASIKRLGWLRNFLFRSVAIWLTGYLILLFAMSLISEEITLDKNEAKEFCGFYLDCHMHAAVLGVRRVKNIGEHQAEGEFYVVNLKIFSDAKRVTLRLAEAEAVAYDKGGRTYSRREEIENLLPTANVSLNQDVANGASFEKEIVFDIAGSSEHMRLKLTEGYGIDKVFEWILIGDEDSIFHKPAVFKLDISEYAD